MKRLSREEALRLHREMWTDMQNELGDNAGFYSRFEFKKKWCLKHQYYYVANHCFLCEYTRQNNIGSVNCNKCPIDWSELGEGHFKNYSYCTNTPNEPHLEIWQEASISAILTLPEREIVEQ